MSSFDHVTARELEGLGRASRSARRMLLARKAQKDSEGRPEPRWGSGGKGRFSEVVDRFLQTGSVRS